MLTNDRERRICAKYSAIDEQGYVHCNECPLNKENHRIWDFRCKATCHYFDEDENVWKVGEVIVDE